MNSNFITEKLFILFQNFDHKLKNAYVFEWESDFFCISTSGYVYEVEIKVSKADFNADFKKRLAYKDNPLKHDWLVDELKVLRPNKFFFACPEGLINKSDIPDKYGLIWIPEYGPAYQVRDSKFLHKNKLFTNLHFTRQMLNKYYYRYLETIRALELRQNDIKHNQKRLRDEHLF